MELTIYNKSCEVVRNMTQTIANFQESFLNSAFGKAVNSALDEGIKFIMPDIFEDEVIEIKDALFTEGLSAGIDTAVEKLMDLGKSAIGIVTGTFESISQIKTAIEDGGVVDTISDFFDIAVDAVEDSNLISENTATLIKNIKDTILDKTTENLNETLTEQEGYSEQLSEYNEAWKEAFEERDFDAMTEAYEKILEYREKTFTTEESYITSEIIENLQSLVENNGGDFDLSEEELELAEKLY